MKIKAAIFDMDGTLVDSLFLWNVLWERIGEKYLGDKSFTPSKEDDKTVRTLSLKDAMELIHKNYGVAESGEKLLDFANDLIKDFYSSEVTMKEGVYEFLKHFKQKGVKMCIASASAPDIIELAVKHCKLEQFFLNIFSCATIGKGKDKPDLYLTACDFLGERPQDTCVFEDSLVAIKTAIKIGMPTVAIYDKYNFGQDEMKKIANHYIADGETLLKLIK